MIDACPVCRYLLRGLNEPIQCPECGLRFGIDPVLFRVSGKPWLAIAAASLVGASIALVLPFSRKGSDPVLYWWVLPQSLLFLGSLFHWRRARSRFLIVSATEARIFHNNTETDVIPLDADTDARWEWTTGRVTFYRSGAESGASFVPQSGRLGRAIVRTIEGRIRQQLASD